VVYIKKIDDVFGFKKIFSELKPIIRETDNLGLVVGYSVMGSLLEFKTKSGVNAVEEIHFEEVKRVYYGLNNVVDSIIENEDYFPIFLDLMNKVNPELNRLFDGKAHNMQSSLMQAIFSEMNSLRRDWTEDNLGRKGMRLINEVNAGVPYTRKHDILTFDYNAIYASFVRKR